MSDDPLSFLTEEQKAAVYERHRFADEIRSLCWIEDLPLLVMAEVLEAQAEALRDAEVERTEG